MGGPLRQLEGPQSQKSLRGPPKNGEVLWKSWESFKGCWVGFYGLREGLRCSWEALWQLKELLEGGRGGGKRKEKKEVFSHMCLHRSCPLGLLIVTDFRTRPIRPTMRPHDDEMIVWWCDNMRLMIYLLENNDFPCFLRKRHQPTDRPTDGQTDTPGYRDARTHLKRPIRPTMRPHVVGMIAWWGVCMSGCCFPLTLIW